MRWRRRRTYRKHWRTLLRAYGESCYYCGEFPTVIDHIIPVAAGGSHEFENLVPSCALCNLLAGDKVFDDLSDKDMYIRKRRRKLRRMTQAICTECLMPFQYRTHSPGLLLCAECYDREFETHHAEMKTWAKWIALLRKAGYDVDAHRKTGEVVRKRGKVRRGEKYRILWNFQEGTLSDDGTA